MRRIEVVPVAVTVGVAALGALALDAGVVAWGLATVLAPSCGNDIAWAVASGLAALATAVAAAGVVAAMARRRRLRATPWDLADGSAQVPDGGWPIVRPRPVWPVGVLAAVAVLGLGALAAAASLPTGGCA